MHLSPGWLFSLFLVGLTAGFVDAIAGGGGLLTVPVLLATGMPTRFALGTNKLQAATGTTLATIHYLRSGLARGLHLGLGIAATAVGAAAGSATATLAKDRWLRVAVPILLIGIAAYTWIKPELGREARKPRLSPTTFGALFGLLIGFYDGFCGPGTGSFWTVAAVLVLGLDLLRATAYAKVMNLTSNLVSLAIFMAAGSVAWGPGLVMAAGQAVGGHLGARSATQGGFRLIRPIFLTVAVLLAGKLLWENLRTVPAPARRPTADQPGVAPLPPV